MALAAAAGFVGGSAGWLVRALVVDHGIQDGSADVAAGVVRRLPALGIHSADVIRVHVADRGSPEASAREARYAALDADAVADDAVVLLGHTLDDQAETVLLGLARGSGTRSLAGMAAQSGRYRRPLLGVDRSVTRRACAALGVHVWNDPHNADERFPRVRVRRQALPVLEAALGPGVAQALARTATAARADADALDALAADLHTTVHGSSGLQVDGLLSATPALRRRVLRAAALDAGCPAGDLFAQHVDAVERLLTHWHGQAGVDLPGKVRAVRSAGELRFNSSR